MSCRPAPKHQTNRKRKRLIDTVRTQQMQSVTTAQRKINIGSGRQAKTRGYTHDIMDQTAFHWIEVVVSECSYSTAGVLEAR